MSIEQLEQLELDILNIVLPKHAKRPSIEEMRTMIKSSYNLAAIKFLIKSETSCEIALIGLDVPKWGKTFVNKYSVILKNKKHEYGFTFYDSVVNTHDNRSAKYDFYSILACLNSNFPENFDDFCSEFGYEFNTEEEYLKVKTDHLACLKEASNLRKLFTPDELEELSEIC